MPLTTLDPKTALIVIDLQKAIVGRPELAHPVEGVVRNAATLAAAFRRHNLPVVLVNADGRAPGRTEQTFRMGDLPPDWAELVPELGSEPSDIRVTKKTWGAFASTDIGQRLKDLGVTEVVVVGIATSAGVESTARQAYEAGFNVALAVDAMTDMSAEAHDNSVKRIFPRLGETATTAEILSRLDDMKN
jgi:nicotinamidase-related amidase